MLQMSQEQQDVVDRVAARDANVCVSAFAGSGKTTVILAACATFVAKGQRCLILTYNTALKDENRRKVEGRGWTKDMCAVHSFHALAFAAYVPSSSAAKVADDSVIENAIYDRDASNSSVLNSSYPNKKLRSDRILSKPFDLICIDEMQDMRPLFIHLLKDFVLSSAALHGGRKPQFLLVGDPFQMVYEYLGASLRYFRDPKTELANLSCVAQWYRMRITTSFRITAEMAEWINRHLSPLLLRAAYPTWFAREEPFLTACWGSGIRASPDRPPAPHSVKYLTTDWAHLLTDTADEVRRMFERQEAIGGKSVLLATSLKGCTESANTAKRPTVALLEAVADRPWIISSIAKHEGNTKIGESLFHKDKRTASTIVAFKGMEADAVVVFGLDAYGEMVHKENQQHPLRIFNTLYVACTRAKQELIVIQFHSKPYATLRQSPICTNPVIHAANVTSLFEHVGCDLRLGRVAAPGGISVLPLQGSHPQQITLPPSMCEAGSGLHTTSTRAFIGLAVEMKLNRLLGAEERELAGIVLSHAKAQSSELSSLTGGKYVTHDADFVEYLRDVESGSEDVFASWPQLVRFVIAAEAVKQNSMLVWRTLCMPSSSAAAAAAASTARPVCDWADATVLDAVVGAAVVALYRIARDLEDTVDCDDDEDGEDGASGTMDESRCLAFLMERTTIQFQRAMCHPAVTSIDHDVVDWIPCITGAADMVLQLRRLADGSHGAPISAVVELKVTSAQEQSHYLQAAAYAAMLHIECALGDMAFRPYVVHALHRSATRIVLVPDPAVKQRLAVLDHELRSPPPAEPSVSPVPSRESSLLSPPQAAQTSSDSAPVPLPQLEFSDYAIRHWSSRPHNRALLLRLVARKSRPGEQMDAQVLDAVAALEDPRRVRNAITSTGATFPVLTPEQQSIVAAIDSGRNVRVIAVAGAGKTTTILASVKKFMLCGKRCMIVTYNAALKTEIREKIKQLGWCHCCRVHSYHSLALGEYVGIRYSESMIDDAIRGQIRASWPVDFLAIDEIQDMTLDYFRLVVDFMTRSNSGRAQMLIVGDPFQQIFQFSGAVLCYLLDPKTHFPTTTREWDYGLKLKVSFRITHGMAQWINENLNPTSLKHVFPSWYMDRGQWVDAAWGDGIFASPSRAHVDGSVVEPAQSFAPTPEIVSAANKIFVDFGLEGSALLSSSTKGSERSPFGMLTHAMSTDPWYINNDQNAFLDAGDSKLISDGKRITSTFHRFKGLEREGIIVSGFDAGIENYYAAKGNFDPLTVYNPMYVACTRARSRLVVLAHNPSKFMTQRTGAEKIQESETFSFFIDEVLKFAPFCRHLSRSDRPGCFTSIVTSTMRKIDMPKSILIVAGKSHADTREDASAVLASCVALRIQQLCGRRIDGSAMLYRNQWAEEAWKKDDILPFIRSVDVGPANKTTWAALAQIAVAKLCLSSRLIHQWRQIGQFDSWMDPVLMDKITLNVLQHLLRIAEFVTNAGATVVERPGDASALAASIQKLCRVDFDVVFSVPAVNPALAEMYLVPQAPTSTGSTTQGSQSMIRLRQWKKHFPGIFGSCQLLLSSATTTAMVDLSLRPKLEAEVVSAAALACVALCQGCGVFVPVSNTQFEFASDARSTPPADITRFVILAAEGVCNQIAFSPLEHLPNEAPIATWSQSMLRHSVLTILRMQNRKSSTMLTEEKVEQLADEICDAHSKSQRTRDREVTIDVDD